MVKTRKFTRLWRLWQGRMSAGGEIMKIERLAEKLEAIDDRICAVVSHSGLSESAYIELLIEQPDGRNKTYKIRMSGHEMRPTYGKLRGHADFEIGKHQDADGDWKA